MPFLMDTVFVTFLFQKMTFLKNIMGTSCDFIKYAEKFSKIFESSYLLEWTCGPQNITNDWK